MQKKGKENLENVKNYLSVHIRYIQFKESRKNGIENFGWGQGGGGLESFIGGKKSDN